MRRRAVVVAVLAMAAVLLLATGAQAHALVRSSNPSNGAVLAEAPPAVVVTFTELPDPKLSFLHVLNSGGQQVERGPSGPVPGKPLELRIPLPSSLPDGVYTVTWRSVSKVDGHVTGGSLTFGIGVAPSSSAQTGSATSVTPSPTPLAVAGRWGFYWGLAILLGGWVIGAFVLGGRLPPGGRLLLAGAWALSAVGLLAMILAERSAVGISLGRLLSSATGSDFVQRAGLLGVVGLLVATFSWRGGPLTLALLGATTAAAMLVHVLAGHAAATGSLTAMNIAVQWLHVLAVGVWIGGLIWLLLGIQRLTGQDRAAMVKRYSRIAGLALGVVAFTGISRALSEVGWPAHWKRLLDTSFGITVLIKVGLFGGLVMLGARNRYVNVPAVANEGRSERPLRLTVTGEVLIAALIFGATGVMSELPPPASVAAAAASRAEGPTPLVLRGHDFATSVRVQLTVTPATVGPNRFEARVTDYDTGRPVRATSVALTFSLPIQPSLGSPTLPLARSSTGLWSGQGTTLSMYGRWDVDVLVQEASTAVTVPLQLTPKLPPEKIQLGTAPGQPTYYTIDLAGGSTLQAYLDPGRAGNDAVHFTFFQGSGSELPITSATAIAVPPGGPPGPIPLIRFDQGHFVANTTLTRGSWRFLIQATAGTGASFSAYFDQTIR